jgi:hypothetical protein
MNLRDAQRGSYTMKRLVLFALLALALPAAALADSITTGDLSFTCRVGGCSPGGAPTSSSFTYDNSTKQFLNFTIVWDGITWGFTGLNEANYDALIGQGPNQQDWTAFCMASPVFPQFPCDDGFGFDLFLLDGNTVSDSLQGTVISETNPVPFASDSGIGAMTAINLDRGPTPTPEPETWILILMVLVIGGTILGWKWAIDPKRRNHGKFHPRTLHQGTMRRPAPMH